MIFVLIITSVFVIIYILLKIKQLNTNKEAVKAQQETTKAQQLRAAGGGDSGPAVPEAKEDVAAPMPASGGDDGVTGFFSFVGPHNLVSLLQYKK